MNPQFRLRHHVTGKIERGEAEPIVEQPTEALAIERAQRIGREQGENAAAWWEQDTIGGRASGDVAHAARLTLRGIEDGDPFIMESLPVADLSGQWADVMTPAMLAEEVGVAEQCFPDVDPSTVADALLDAICDAYEEAYNEAAQHAVERYCQALLDNEEDQ